MSVRTWEDIIARDTPRVPSNFLATFRVDTNVSDWWTRTILFRLGWGTGIEL